MLRVPPLNEAESAGGTDNPKLYCMSRLPEVMRSPDDTETYEKTSKLIRGAYDQKYGTKRTFRDQFRDFLKNSIIFREVT